MWGIPHTFVLFLLSEIIIAVPNLNLHESAGLSQPDIVANLILKSINKSVDPCENFYEYACGNWKTNFPKPINPKVWYVETMTESMIQDRLRVILEEEIKPDDPTALQYEKTWFQYCNNLAMREKDGLKPLEDKLISSGGWPMSMKDDEWDNSNLWQNVESYYKYYMDLYSHSNALFELRIFNDNRNYSKFSIFLNAPTQSVYEDLLSNDGTIKDTLLEKYKDFMKKVTLAFAKSRGSDVSSEKLLNDVEAVIEFESELHKIKSTAKDLQDVDEIQNFMKIKDFQTWYDEEHHKNDTSKINWLQIISNIFKVVNITVNDSEEIVIADKPYFKKLSGLLDKTPNRIIVNYIQWTFLVYNLEISTQEMLHLVEELYSEYSGSKEKPETWFSCLTDMKLQYGQQLKYLETYFSEDLKKMGLEMVIKIRDKLIDDVRKLSWLEESTKDRTIKKINKLNINVGDSDIFKNATFMSHVYDKFELGKSYLETLLSYRKFQMKSHLSRLRNFNDKKNKPNPNAIIAPQASYSDYENALDLNTAELSIPFFGASLPMSVNYGFLGSIVGSKSFRIMDKKGHTIDEDGNENSTWWPQSMQEEYNKRSECFVNQFNDYSIDGKLTRRQNMADTVGLQLSYKTFHEILGDSVERKLPGLEELTSDQLFFLSFALTQCATLPNGYWSSTSAYSYHSPNKERVIGTVSNSEAFAKAYKCPSKSPMNPERKCHL